MRRLIPALILSLAVLAVGIAPAGASPAKPAAVGCISLPDLKLPSVCDIKAGTIDLAAKLGAQLGVSLQAALSGAIHLTAALGAQVSVALPNVLTLLLALPPALARLLCL